MDEKINAISRPAQTPKKKILFVITQSEMGGAQRFMVQLISGLPKDRFDCIVASGQDGGNELEAALPPDTPHIAVPSLYREPDLADDFRSIFELRKIYQDTAPDIIFLNSSKAGFNGSIAAIGLSKKPVVIYRIGGWSFNDPRPSTQRIFFKLLEKLSDSLKDYIIVNNNRDLEDARRLKISPGKELLMVHNGIDPYAETLSRDEARARLFEKTPPLQAPHLLGVIANFYPTKGLITLIEAFKEVKSGAKCLIIGDGRQRPELEALLEKYGLKDRVILAGRISDAGQLIRAFDALILPSLKEGFPWAVLEAMAAKVPVIATRVGAIQEIIEDGRNGLSVEPGNPSALAEAIDKILADENTRMQYAIEGHQTIIRRFSLAKMVNAYIDLFSRV